MSVIYWIITLLLAAFYLCSGGMKLVRSNDQLRPMMGWIDTIPMPVVRIIGVLEIAGSLGLVLPPLAGVAPPLAVAAAAGLALLQVGGIIVHLRRGEARVLGLNVVLLGAAIATAFLATTLT